MMKSKILISIFLSLVFFISLVTAKEFEVNVSIKPKELTTSPCGIATYDISVKNLGEKEDIYYMIVEGIPEGWYTLTHESITLGAGKSKTIYLFITADCYTQPATYAGFLTALGNAEDSDDFVMNVVAEHILKVELPRTISSCLCEETRIIATIENTGKFDENVVLTLSGDASNFASLDENSFTLKKGDKRDVIITLNPTCDLEPAEYSLELKAESTNSYARASGVSRIERIKCHDFTVSYDKEIKTCANEAVPFKISVKNTGTKENMFEVKIEALDYSESASIKPGETKVLSTSFLGKEYGTVDLAFVVKSDYKVIDGSIRFIIEKCYGVDLQPEQNELQIKIGTGKLLRAKLVNTGTREDSFNISADISWVSIRPQKVTLGSNQTDDVFAYYSPEFGASGIYETSLIAESEKSRDEEKIKITVVKEEIPKAEEERPVIEINVTPEITIEENVTPAVPTGQEVRTRLKNLLQNKLILALLIGVILALIVFGFIYLLVMRS